MPPTPPAPGAPATAIFSSFLELGNECFGGEHQARNGSCVLQRQAGGFGRVDDAHSLHIAVFTGLRVVAEVLFLRFADLADHHRAFGTGVVGNLAGRLFQSAPHDARANSLVILKLELLHCAKAANKRCAAAGNDAFLDSRPSGVHSVFHASLLFLQLRLGSRANLDDGDAAYQLGKALLELLLVVIGSGVLDLLADLLHAAFDFGCLARALDNRGIVLVDGNFLGAAEVLELHVLQLDSQVLGDGLPPVRVAMSSNMALRRSPKPGALTAAHCSVPRSLLTTRVASASPSTSSAIIRRGLPAFAMPSSKGSKSFIELIFFSWIRMRTSSSTHSMRSGSVMK